MNENNKLLLAILIIAIFSTTIFNIPTYTKRDNTNTQNLESNNQPNEKPINEDPNNLENLRSSDISEEQLNQSFSFNTLIKESWNQTFVFSELNSTKPDNSQTDWITLQRTKGSNMYFYFFMYYLLNLTSMEYVYPSNFTTMKLSY